MPHFHYISTVTQKWIIFFFKEVTDSKHHDLNLYFNVPFVYV